MLFRPLTLWPHAPTRTRAQGRFRTGFQDTLNLLARELEFLRARDVVIQLAILPAEIRNDGYPRANARPSHPGVIISFTGRHGPLSFPCDTYLDWKDNLRAIALALEALRAVDRYGVTQRAEQYRGWAQLGDGNEPVTGTPADLEQAAALLLKVAKRGRMTSDPRAVLASPEVFETVRRLAIRYSHPDQGGSNEEFLRVDAAISALRAHHGL
ncbi:MAG: molecular chaperone DnaJ [Actinomycetota bacterium]